MVALSTACCQLPSELILHCRTLLTLRRYVLPFLKKSSHKFLGYSQQLIKNRNRKVFSVGGVIHCPTGLRQICKWKFFNYLYSFFVSLFVFSFPRWHYPHFTTPNNEIDVMKMCKFQNKRQENEHILFFLRLLCHCRQYEGDIFSYFASSTSFHLLE